MDRADRRRLHAALAEVAPWLADPEVGPSTVDAGSCDLCGELPRVVTTCGPAPARTLCVDCIGHVGDRGWCTGHADVAARARAWASEVPAWWADAVVLWWVATGEVRVDRPLDVDPGTLPGPVRAALPPER